VAFTYQSGEEVKKGDRVIYHGEAGEIEFVAGPLVKDPETDWYIQELGGGVMIIESRIFGRVIEHDPTSVEDLEFVSRCD
jgi:hypothetical protein